MKPSDPIFFERRCDASGGIALTAESWVGANDEVNALQRYSVTGGPPLEDSFLPLDEFLDITGKPDQREADLESATQIGDVVWWIGSHSQSRSGKKRPNRQRLFATRIVHDGAVIRLEPHGRACKSLRKVMLKDQRLKKFDLEMAAGLPPKEGGFNIEAICADPAGQRLWVGLRSPIRQGLALLVPVEELAALAAEGRPTLGEPRQVDLGGLGFRDMIGAGGEYLILAGDSRGHDHADAKPARLYRWGGPEGGSPVPLAVDFGTLNPEALVLFPDRRVLVVSDDGTQPCDGGLKCKDEGTPEANRRFRAVWLPGFWPFP